MNRNAVAFAATVLVVGAACPDLVDAAEYDTLPEAEAARPLVAPAMTFRGDLHIPIQRVDFGIGGGRTVVGFPFLGAGFSPTNWVQIDAAVLPIIISPDAEFSGPEFAATFAFLGNDADIEVGGRIGFQIPGTTEFYSINLGVPVRFHLADDVVRLDTGFSMSVWGSSSGGDANFGLLQSRTLPFHSVRVMAEPSIPVDVTVSIVESFFVRGYTGFGVITVEESDSVFFPLGFGAGGSIPVEDGFLIDVRGDLGFPILFTPEEVVGDTFRIGLTGSVYYDFDS
ncbi:MAG: hypothetical protein AAF715_01030 [Myxococcota bacterium]